MYFKDKTEVFKLRLTPEQLVFVDECAKRLGVTRSAVMRIIIDSYRCGLIKDENK